MSNLEGAALKLVVAKKKKKKIQLKKSVIYYGITSVRE